MNSLGGRSRIRTYDPLIKSQLLYQLSYAPVSTRRARLYQHRPLLQTPADAPGRTGGARGSAVTAACAHLWPQYLYDRRDHRAKVEGQMDYLIGQKPAGGAAAPGQRQTMQGAPPKGMAAPPAPAAADDIIIDADQTSFMRDVVDASRSVR